MTPERWRQVEEMLHAALSHGESERAAFLGHACVGDLALRREVELLLAQQASMGGFLENPPMATVAPIVSETGASLLTGRRLGAYQVHARIGVGGMGEVYRAHDTRLRRDVAIKILPRAFTADPDRLARFEREARVLASLNHPNIATIYGVEEGDGVKALVMELVAGETLADRLGRHKAARRSRTHADASGLPVTEVVSLAQQIADALDAAHERGVVHRDLKPANIAITPEGVVKVLDFGLAKAVQTGEASEADTVSGTHEGTILGTPAYMSPEQARGQVVDKRTDIWAFGCVLYELLAGQGAFGRASITDTLAAIIEREPDWSALPPSTPASIRRLLARCLDKDAKKRLRDIGDVHLELEEAVAKPLTARDSRSSIAAKPPAQRVALWVAVALLGGLTSGMVLWRMTGTAVLPAQPPAQFTIQLPPGEPLGQAGERLAPANTPPLALSPDGRFLAYNTTRNGRRALYLRVLADREPRLVTEGGGVYPFFSPDSQWLGFFEGGKMKKVSVGGGPSIVIADAPGSRGASWSDDDFIVFAPQSRVSLSGVAASGGQAQVLTTLDLTRGETSHRTPMWLPGGRAVVYRAEGTTDATSTLKVFSRDTNQQRVLVSDGGFQPHYAPTGHLLFLQGEDLMAVPFDATRLEFAGTPTRVLAAVQTFSLTNHGTLVYSTGASPSTSLVWVDRRGAATSLPPPSQEFALPRLSRDNDRVVMHVSVGGDGNVWTYDLARDVLMRLTFEGSNLWPAWMPDGRSILYASNRMRTAWDIFLKPADGSGTETPLLTQPLAQNPQDISLNGEWLAYGENTVQGGEDIWVRPLRAASLARPFAHTPARERGAAFSPDGRWIAYTSDESGSSEAYVRPLADGTGKWQISAGGGTEPRWNPDGKELFYRDGGKMFVVPVITGRTFAAGTPQLLFEESEYPLSGIGTNYDVARDGQRFLMIREERSNEVPASLIVVTNWFQELMRLVPTGR